MTHEELSLMGWKQTELEPALGTVVFLCSWSFIPISISVLMFSFNKYDDYIIHACMVAIILQTLSLYLVLSRHQIALQYSSIRNRIMAGIFVLSAILAIQLTNIEYDSLIQIGLLLVFTYISLSTIQLYANNLGSLFEHPWSEKEKISSEQLPNWEIQSFIFSTNAMAIRTMPQKNCIAWISGQMNGEELKLVVEIFGHHPKEDFDFLSLEINFDNHG